MEMVAQTPCLTLPHIAFLPIARPKLKPEPPAGPEWLHEIKFDAFRIELHKRGREVRLFSPHGKDFTDRFPSIAAGVLRLPVRRATIDPLFTPR